MGDALIAGTAKVHDLSITTRNVTDFNGLDVDVTNPRRGTATTITESTVEAAALDWLVDLGSCVALMLLARRALGCANKQFRSVH